MRKILILSLILVVNLGFARETISLDGTWDVAEGFLNEPPSEFPSTIHVPGFLDMASPAFENVGARVENPWDLSKGFSRPSDPLREAFWYRRTFDIGDELPKFAELKINKAAYTTQVFINGKLAGTRYSCFTPNYFTITHLLQKGENTILIRVGAGLSAVPRQYVEGYDLEKKVYTPGIYDSVSLTLTEDTFIKNVQIAPDIKKEGIRVVGSVWNRGDKKLTTPLTFKVKERNSKKVVATLESTLPEIIPTQDQTFDVFVKIPNAKLWSPESPFLYELEVLTQDDTYSHRFGMREFRGDEETGMFYLNDKPYYLRGTNFTFFRFVEDADRKALPYDKDWLTKLFLHLKDLEWNSVRFCIGFPPEIWYEFADEMGILVQDEFPVWYENFTHLLDMDEYTTAGEYRAWMQEHWNYPSVVIWDILNETIATPEMEYAKRQVRNLDLSNRPWDNGWGWRSQAGDPSEHHPYRIGGYKNHNQKFPQQMVHDTVAIPPHDGKGFITTTKPKILNEYGFLWLKRDGNPTKLTKPIYDYILGENYTVEEAREAYGRYFALLTEHWRHKGRAAAILHFTFLSFDADYAVTCDNFTDITKLTFEPRFYKYLKDSFSPVGVALNYYETDVVKNSETEFEIFCINDTYKDWSGDMYIHVKDLKSNKILSTNNLSVSCPAVGKETFKAKIKMPAKAGKYEIIATISPVKGKNINSVRYLNVVD